MKKLPSGSIFHGLKLAHDRSYRKFLAFSDSDQLVIFCFHICVETGQDQIVNVASLSGLKAIPLIPACYTASKFAVVGMTKQLALQLASDNIRVNAICPGSVRTDMTQVVMQDKAAAEGITVEEAEADEAEAIVLGRAADPSEIGQVAAWLAAPFSSNVPALVGNRFPNAIADHITNARLASVQLRVKCKRNAGAVQF